MDSTKYPELTGVLFPGIVKNTDKAIQCLGGIRNISQVYSQPIKKLGLSYRPEDPFLKKIYGEPKKTAGILLKVKVKNTKTGSEVKKDVISTTVVGQVKKIYRFESMCDFQYLPIQVESDGSNKCILEQVFPSGLDKFDFMLDPGPTYVVPGTFTRSERPYNYAYTDKKHNEKVDSTDKDLVGHRRSRKIPAVKYVFSLTNELPTEPNESSLLQIKAKIKNNPTIGQNLETIKKMFEERPIWSSNMIRYKTKIRVVLLKYLLTCVAVYMNSGPWKKLWVRFGYDPRKTPESRIYQSLDVRVRHTAGMNAMVMKRHQLTQVKRADRDRRTENMGPDDVVSAEDVEEGAVYFRSGVIPTQRQMFYQYCDVKLPEVEELLAAEPPPGYLCHGSRGWLPPNTDQKCRDYISQYMKDTIFASSAAGADLKLEQGSSDDDTESNSEDADDDDPNTSTAATGDEMV